MWFTSDLMSDFGHEEAHTAHKKEPLQLSIDVSFSASLWRGLRVPVSTFAKTVDERA
jgi:hypothetical protein